jgi:hypothetical protein
MHSPKENILNSKDKILSFLKTNFLANNLAAIVTFCLLLTSSGQCFHTHRVPWDTKNYFRVSSMEEKLGNTGFECYHFGGGHAKRQTGAVKHF